MTSPSAPGDNAGDNAGDSIVCECCAGEDEELVAVWPAGSTAEQPELWCADCRERNPHEVAEDGGDDESSPGA